MQINEFKINNTSIYYLQTKKFKTNLFGFSFILPLSNKYLPELTLLSQVFTKLTKSFKSEREFALKLNELYDSQIFYNFEKKGQVLQITFYLHVISDKFINTNNTLIQDAFNLFEEVLFDKKNITKEILEKEKKIYIESFESKIANVYYSSGIVLYDTMFDKENYHNHLDSNIEEINKVTLNSLNEAYDLLMSSAKFGFVIGDLNEDVICDLFKNTPNTELSLPPFIDKETKDITKTNIKMVPVNLPQSMLLMGYRTDIRVDSKKYFAMCLLNKYLGGGFDSLFIKELRENHNLVYTIGSEYDWYKGIMIINCGINYEDYETVVDLIKQCIDDIKNKIIDKELLSAIKKQMISEQMEAEDNLISLIEIVNQKYFYQNKIISNQKKIDKINNITEEDIIEVAKSLLLDTIVLVGKE